jgi:hypothetical protein
VLLVQVQCARRPASGGPSSAGPTRACRWRPLAWMATSGAGSPASPIHHGTPPLPSPLPPLRWMHEERKLGQRLPFRPEQPRPVWRELLDQLLKRLQRVPVVVHDRGSEEQVPVRCRRARRQRGERYPVFWIPSSSTCARSRGCLGRSPADLAQEPPRLCGRSVWRGKTGCYPTGRGQASWGDHSAAVSNSCGIGSQLQFC